MTGASRTYTHSTGTRNTHNTGILTDCVRVGADWTVKTARCSNVGTCWTLPWATLREHVVIWCCDKIED